MCECVGVSVYLCNGKKKRVLFGILISEGMEEERMILTVWG